MKRIRVCGKNCDCVSVCDESWEENITKYENKSAGGIKFPYLWWWYLPVVVPIIIVLVEYCE